MTPMFIGLSGKKQVGKNAAGVILAKILLQHKNPCFIIEAAFADPLKEMCIEVLGLNRDLVYGSNEDKNTLTHIKWDGFPAGVKKMRYGPMTVREVLQSVGTGLFRAFYPDVWANAPFNKNWWNYHYVIFVDCRFPNEVRAIEEHGGIVIRLERDTCLNDEHESETALDNYKFEHVYHNNGTLQDLEDFLCNKLKELKII